jgi:hypothetical protein
MLSRALEHPRRCGFEVRRYLVACAVIDRSAATTKRPCLLHSMAKDAGPLPQSNTREDAAISANAKNDSYSAAERPQGGTVPPRSKSRDINWVIFEQRCHSALKFLHHLPIHSIDCRSCVTGTAISVRPLTDLVPSRMLLLKLTPAFPRI